MGYEEIYSALEILKTYNVYNKDYLFLNPIWIQEYQFIKRLMSSTDDNKNYMRSLDIMVTTKCSLKCKNCSNLMQYYKNPNNTSHDEILNALKVIDKAVDEISEYRIIGGEPMMNKDWANIVKSIIEMKPEKRILYILMELYP